MLKKPHLSLFIGVVIGGILSVFSSPAQAQTSEAPKLQSQELFGNSGILFTMDTLIQFKFIRSHGAYQSVLKTKLLGKKQIWLEKLNLVI